MINKIITDFFKIKHINNCFTSLLKKHLTVDMNLAKVRCSINSTPPLP